jgi:hypothetical protein
MDHAGFSILILNAILGFGVAWPLSSRLIDLTGKSNRRFLFFTILVIVYFIECLAFVAGMATNIFSILLAFFWGLFLAMLLKRFCADRRNILKNSVFFSFYSSLPAMSFLSVPLLMFFNNWSITSIRDGARFGIPDFVSWPFNTILGFCSAVAITAAVAKVIITTGLVALLIRLHGAGRVEENI